MSKEVIETPKKKKLIRIGVAPKSPFGEYKPSMNSGVNFAFVSAEDEIKDGVRHKYQISKFVTCREQLCEMPRSSIHEQNIYELFPYKDHKIDLTKLRLLIAIQGVDFNKDHIYSAKRVINILEEDAGWPTSVITTVKYEAFSPNEKFWLFTGDAKWLHAPQMLSLVCLIFRLGCKFGPFQATNIEEVRQAFNRITKDSTSMSFRADQEYIGTVRKHISKLMRSFDKIFTKEPGHYYIDPKGPSPASGWTGFGGIDSFCKCATGSKELTELFKTHVLND